MQAFRPATWLKRDSYTGVFQLIMRDFKENQEAITTYNSDLIVGNKIIIC